MAQQEENGYDSKYRPTYLDDVIGHEQAVTRLKGVIESKQWPKALLFTGPTSVGKTTLARAFASTVLGKSAYGHPDFIELNAADSRSIDDMRELIALSKLRPTSGIRRFILVDEAQGILATPASAEALLKPVESPPKTTTWIFGSMDPEKFQSNQKGKALANRCQQFALKAPSDEELTAYGRRIIKGEGLTYFTKEVLQKLVENCDKEMRSLAALIQGSAQYYQGLPKGDRPEKLGLENVTEILRSATNEDDVTAVRILVSVYARKFIAAQKDLLNVVDGFGMVNKLMNLNWFVMNTVILKGGKHPKLWGNRHSYELLKNFHKVADEFGPADLAKQVQMLATIQDSLTQLKYRTQAFSMSEQMVMSNALFTLIQKLKEDLK